MAILDESFYDPVPGYTQTRRRRTETPPPADVPRGGMRYGLGDERDLSVPVIDPRDPLAPSPATWSGVVPRGSGRAAYSTNGGYAFTNAPAVPDETTPRVPFANAAGESLAATAARGARMQAEQDRLGLTTADMDYIRTYGRAAYDARQSKYGQPTTRADYLARQGQNLAISVAERNAAQQELSRIDADQRRQDALAADAARMAAQLRMAEMASRPAAVSFGAGAGAMPNADGGWDYQTPPQAAPAAPGPVSFGGGAGAIPEIGEDGQPTGRYVYQAPPTPSADTDRPVALGGGGMGVKDPATGEWTIKIPPKQGEKGARAVTLKPGESYYDPETKETYVAPGADRQSIEAEIANLTAALGKAFEPNAIAAIERQLADARARLAALGAPAPAPGGASSPSEPQPAPATSPTPAPAQPAAPASPTGHRRWTPGA